MLLTQATLQATHRCTPAPYGMLAVPAALPTGPSPKQDSTKRFDCNHVSMRKAEIHVLSHAMKADEVEELSSDLCCQDACVKPKMSCP